tara:strand:- start:16 stop:2058 length:2043 start_codon:yes stop_codon:yes gene_type:complete
MKKYLLLSALTIVLFGNSMFSQSELNSSHIDIKDEVSEKFFRQMEDSLFSKSVPQNLTTLMTDNSEVRLDSTVIVDPGFYTKTKTIYNDEGQIIKIMDYNRAGNTLEMNGYGYGYDTEGVTITVIADEWGQNSGMPAPDSSVIQSFSMITNGVEYGCSWYEATLTISGGILDGQTIQGCGENFVGLDITGFSSITITGFDIDNYSDLLEMYIEIQNNYTVDNIFNLSNVTLYDFDENGNQILYERTFYNGWQIGGGDIMTGYSRQETTFNEDNRILTFQIYSWDQGTETIYFNLDQERFYDDNGSYILGQQFFYNPDASISFGEKYEFVRDDQDIRIFRVHSVWDEGSGFFLVNDESEYRYFDNLKWDIELNHNGSVSLDNSSPSYKNTTSREGNTTVGTGYNWNLENGLYEPGYRNEEIKTYYDDETLETSIETQLAWDDEINNFITNYRTSYNYDEAGNRTYFKLESLVTFTDQDQNLVSNLVINSEEIFEFDENNNLIMRRSNYYDINENFLYGAVISEYTFNEDGFITERLNSNIQIDLDGSEAITPYYREVYSTILDNNTDFIRMGTPFTYNNGNWEEYVGADYKSYYYYTKTSSLTQGENSLSSLDLFPNPTNSVLQLNSDINHQIEVYDLIGRKLMEKTGNNIDISSLPNSTYIVKITDLASNETFSKKIIKE